MVSPLRQLLPKLYLLNCRLDKHTLRKCQVQAAILVLGNAHPLLKRDCHPHAQSGSPYWCPMTLCPKRWNIRFSSALAMNCLTAASFAFRQAPLVFTWGRGAKGNGWMWTGWWHQASNQTQYDWNWVTAWSSLAITRKWAILIFALRWSPLPSSRNRPL